MNRLKHIRPCAKSKIFSAIIFGAIVSALAGFTDLGVLRIGDSRDDIEAVECEISNILLRSATAVDEYPHPREYRVVGTDPNSGVRLIVLPDDPLGHGSTLVKTDPDGNTTTIYEKPETWRSINNVGNNLCYANQCIAQAKIMSCLNARFPVSYWRFNLSSYDWSRRFEDAVKPWVFPDPHALRKAICHGALTFLYAFPCAWFGLIALIYLITVIKITVVKSWDFTLTRMAEFTNAIRGKSR